MWFLEKFRKWIIMLLEDATTTIVLPNGLSRTIRVVFCFRQGDPVAMNLYIIQQEPLLRMLRSTLTGLTMNNFKLIDKANCDDVQTLSEDVDDFVKLDEVMQKFESMSGAILSRNKKSKSEALSLS